MDALNACMCGDVLDSVETEDASVSIRCTKPNCETVWYHLEHVTLNCARRGWVCPPCKAKRQRT
ncbi:hypothetical protein C8R43DRAFT_319768 [Mycena crocata]|nr:hypothetical protein C8R43DRAFT_319768 [Mycena crocata]